MNDAAEIETWIGIGPANPRLLDDPEAVWFVRAGRIDLFAVPVDESGRAIANGRFILTLEAGMAAFGVPAVVAADGMRVALRASASTGTEIAEFRRAGLPREFPDGSRLSALVDQWISSLTAAVTGPDIRTDTLVAPGVNPPIKRGVRIGGLHDGRVLWIAAKAGELCLLGRESARFGPGDPPLPLSEPAWVLAVATATIDALPTADLAADKSELAGLWRAFDRAGTTFLTLSANDLATERAAEEARFDRKLRLTSGLFRSSLDKVAAVLEKVAAPVPPETAGDTLLVAAQLVAARQGMSFAPGAMPAEGDGPDRLDALCRSARINLRRVALNDDWRRRDNGPLLGFRAGPGKSALPVALLPVGEGAYEIVDPETGAAGRVDASKAAELLPAAYMFYRGLPDRPLTLSGVMRFGLAGRRADIARVLIMGLFGGLLSLMVPVISEPLFGAVLPRADIGTLATMILAMAMSAVGVAALALVRGIAVLRNAGRMEGTIQPAIWDRVLRLPTGFFRGFTTGDLADRVTGISSIRVILSATLSRALMDGLFSLISFCLLFYYSWRLALVATAIAGVAVLVTGGLSALQIPHQRAQVRDAGRLGGETFQLLIAIAKLRIAGGEARAFARWAGLFAEQKDHAYRARRIAAVQNVVAQAFPPIASIAIYAAVIKLGTEGTTPGVSQPLLAIGAYMAFSAAFGQFIGGLIPLITALTQVVAIVPMVERVRPILAAVPEYRERADPPGTLSGDIEFRHVTFRYVKDTPPVLDDVSWQLRPGQYLAFVGPSGSGKSTIVRLLLGFERPESGGVLFDQKDLSTLHVDEVRRQIGVVMQGAGLLAGNIYENIVGTLPLTMEDAWEAARMAGLEQDIRDMPMGMHTVLSDSAATLSGGQRQRLVIARALVRKPRILIFDEATSALDNRTQALIKESLDQLNMTRIVIAHRLSTIRHVDRICVLSDGRIAETGTFDELMAADGMFAKLAKRQVE
jgi:ATP-binding cassette subfamily C protein